MNTMFLHLFRFWLHSSVFLQLSASDTLHILLDSCLIISFCLFFILFMQRKKMKPRWITYPDHTANRRWSPNSVSNIWTQTLPSALCPLMAPGGEHFTKPKPPSTGAHSRQGNKLKHLSRAGASFGWGGGYKWALKRVSLGHSKGQPLSFPQF